jgi:rubredoxin
MIQFFKKILVKINVRGGILPSGELSQLIKIAQTFEVENTQLGQRQNIYFYVNRKYRFELEDMLKDSSLDYEIDSNQHPNIVSSYAAEDIFTTHPWFSEGMYQDILESFNYKPKIKINLCDNTQAIAPLFTGVLNFIPSTHLNFYFLYINHPKVGNKWCWNKLIYGNDIAAVSQKLELILINTAFNGSIDEALDEMVNSLKLITMPLDEALQVPRIRFPYYEGMNKFGNKIWLGIYRRENDFSIALLKSILDLCNITRIAQVQLLPWKSIMIKGIAESERIEWEKLLSIHGINSRHSSLELNWHTGDLDSQAVRIKQDLVKGFNKLDIRTYGLSFALATSKPLELSSTVLIVKRKSIFNFWGIFKFLTIFDILYAPSFSLHATEYQYYATNIAWNGLSSYLQSLCDIYYKQLSEQKSTLQPKAEEKPQMIKVVHQCKHCLSIYDAEYGDSKAKIPAGISFDFLPEDYCCPVCDSPKSDFSPIEFTVSAS